MFFAKSSGQSQQQPRVWSGCVNQLLGLAVCLASGLPTGVHGQTVAQRSPINLAPATVLPPADFTRERAIARAGELINTIREKLDACGDNGMLALNRQPDPDQARTEIPKRPPLQWNTQLASAAEQHARAMVEQRFFDHVDPAGNTVGSRVTQAGYRWRLVGENLAAGHDSIEDAVQGWLLSTGHCEVMIDDSFTEFGLARVRSTDPLDSYGVYWALVVAEPRH